MKRKLLMIPVYVAKEEKSKIEKNAKKYKRSVSSYLKLKGLELI